MDQRFPETILIGWADLSKQVPPNQMDENATTQVLSIKTPGFCCSLPTVMGVEYWVPLIVSYTGPFKWESSFVNWTE